MFDNHLVRSVHRNLFQVYRTRETHLNLWDLRRSRDESVTEYDFAGAYLSDLFEFALKNAVFLEGHGDHDYTDAELTVHIKGTTACLVENAKDTFKRMWHKDVEDRDVPRELPEGVEAQFEDFMERFNEYAVHGDMKVFNLNE